MFWQQLQEKTVRQVNLYYDNLHGGKGAIDKPEPKFSLTLDAFDDVEMQ